MNTILQLKVTLRGTKPPIWRRVLVENTVTFEALHDIIQTAMGWTNSHLHEFNVNGVRIGQMLDDFDADFGDGLIDDATVTLHSALTPAVSKFEYLYDFGDSWEHAVVVEKWLTADAAVTYPVCTGGKLHAPPEDCGGIPGFYQLLTVVADKRHPEHEEMLEWLGDEYDPQAFNQQEVNRQLAALFHP